MDMCPNYQNNGYLDARLKKREMNKIAHVFLQKVFQASKKTREIGFKEHSRIRLATIYIHTHAHLDLRV